MVSEARKQSMARMETDYSKHTYFWWKVKWRLEHLGALGTMGETTPLITIIRLFVFEKSFPVKSTYYLFPQSSSYLKLKTQILCNLVLNCSPFLASGCVLSASVSFGWTWLFSISTTLTRVAWSPKQLLYLYFICSIAEYTLGIPKLVYWKTNYYNAEDLHTYS